MPALAIHASSGLAVIRQTTSWRNSPLSRDAKKGASVCFGGIARFGDEVVFRILKKWEKEKGRRAKYKQIVAEGFILYTHSMAVEKVSGMPLAQSSGAAASSPASAVGLRFKRRRRRVVILLAFLVTTSVAIYMLFGGSTGSSKNLSSLLKSKGGLEQVGGNNNNDGGSSGEENTNIIGALFDIDAVNKYFNRLTEETKKAEEQTEKKESELLNQVNDKSETLLNDAEELRKLYLTKEHDGMINLGSTGNMADQKLNVLKLKDKMSELEELEVKENLESKENLKSNPAEKDRSMPLSDSMIPDEESFSKIKTDDFIKGDITFQNFFSHILELIARNHLSFPLKRRMTLENGKPVIDNVLFYEDTAEILSEQQLYTFFDFPQNFIDDLKMKHENVINGIPDISPNFYSGNGYVSVGGGLYSWYALLGIETLRKVGSTLPVEIFLPNEEDYDYQYCEKILPKLNAKCIEMHRVFGSDALKNFQVEGYQYKAFALLASSFENAFLLDSDTYAVTNPDVLFESELYQNYKMITWPDFWRRTTSPVFYEIRGTEVGMVPVRHLNDFFVNPEFLNYKPEDDVSTAVTYHDRAGTIPDFTTESGEMLINKKEHFKTLILALYYNHDGPYGYYPLLSQGGAGEGDKETFVAAANFYNKKYYQVYKKPERFFGWFNNVQNYEHSTIVQYNPLLDYEMLQNVHTQLRQDMESQGENFVYDYNKYYSDVFTPDVCEPIFYHVHDPKLNPYKIMEEKWTENLEGKKIRNLAEDFPRVNFDLERFLWNVMNHYLCELKLKIPAFDGKDADKMCNEFMVGELAYLDKSSDKITAVYSPTNNVEQMHGGRDWN